MAKEIEVIKGKYMSAKRKLFRSREKEERMVSVEVY